MPSLDGLAAYTERRFRSTCTVTRPGTGEPVWDGEKYVTPQDTVYTGGCELKSVEAETKVVQAGDRAVSLNTYKLTLSSAAEVQLGDTATVTDSPDALAIGLKLRVIDVPKSDLTTARTVMAEEQT